MNIRLKPVWIAWHWRRVPPRRHLFTTGMWGWGGWAFAHDIDDFSQDVGKDATAINAFVGYNYNENLGAELGYLSTGDWDIAGQDFNQQGATLSVIGRLPLGTSSLSLPKGRLSLSRRLRQRGDDNLAPGGSGPDRQTERPGRHPDPLPLHGAGQGRSGQRQGGQRYQTLGQRHRYRHHRAGASPNRTVAAVPVAPLVVAPPPRLPSRWIEPST